MTKKDSTERGLPTSIDAGAIAPNGWFDHRIKYPGEDPTFLGWSNSESDLVVSGQVKYEGPAGYPKYETTFEIAISLPSVFEITLDDWTNTSIN